jgi:ATP-binding cassette, subfamily B, bacterial CvaB/MchF/RaxB
VTKSNSRGIDEPFGRFWERLEFGFNKRLQIVLQSEAAECGLACIVMIARFYGYRTDIRELRRLFSFSLKGSTLAQLIHVANSLKLASRPLRIELDYLPELQTPAILHWNLNHFVVLAKANRRGIKVFDPATGIRYLRYEEVSKHFTGVALELVPTDNFETKKENPSVKLTSLFKKSTGFKRSLFQVFILALTLQVFALLNPLFMQWVVDSVLVSRDHELLTTLTVGFLLLVLMSTAFAWMRSWMVLYMSTNIGLQWLASVFTHLLKLPVSFFEKRHIGDVVSRIGSLQTIQRTLTTSFIEAVLDGLLVVVTFVMMFFYSSALTSIVVVAMFVYAVLRYLSYLPLRTAKEEEIVLLAMQQSHLLESIRGIQSIKLFGREDERRSKFLSLAVDATNKHIRSERLFLINQLGSALIFGFCAILVVYFGAMQVLNNLLTAGMLFAYIAYTASFSGRVAGLIDKWVEFSMLSLQLERLADIVLSEEETLHGSVQIAPQSLRSTSSSFTDDSAAIELRDVSFRYSDGEPLILKKCSLSIRSNEFVAITGASGSGKTTLVKVLLGLLKPSEGEVLIGGISIKQLSLASVRKQVGTVMQDDQLFAGSIADNIHFFDPQIDQDRVEECAKMAFIHDEIARMPMGYNTFVGDMGTTLSGGQKQRVLLARALYKRPIILVLDEATSHLDVTTEKAVNEAISSLMITRITIAHRPDTIAKANRVVNLSNGSVV